MTFRPFSLRNRAAIRDGKLTVTMSELLRRRTWALLTNLDHGISIQRDPNDNWTDNTSVIFEAARELAVHHADDELDKIVRSRDDELRGRLGPALRDGDAYRFLDFIELCLAILDRGASPTEQINATFAEEGCGWKIVDGVFEQVLPPIPREVRQPILDFVRAKRVSWWGTLDEVEFAGRLVDVESLPSKDGRFKKLSGDIWQHRVNNPGDWDDNWILTDDRVDLIGCDERRFIKFIELLINPDIQMDPSAVTIMSERFDRLLRRCGYSINKGDVRRSFTGFTVKYGTTGNAGVAGGFGEVRFTVLNGKSVAIKSLLHERRSEVDAVRRFKHEIECLQKLAGKRGVVALINPSVQGDEYAYAMERADGNLEDYLARMPLLAEIQRVMLMERILAAFVEVHDAEVLHRDICPKNILMFGDIPKVSDFGLSVDCSRTEALTRSSQVAGKDAYMAPEAKDGLKNTTSLSDVYSLGKLMQFLLMGTEPSGEPRGTFAPIIRRATEFSASKRYDSVAKMLDVLTSTRIATTAKRNASTLSDYAQMVTAGEKFDPILFHELAIGHECAPSEVYKTFWDPVTDLMTGLRAEAYGRWAAADDRVLDYVNICEAMYKKLPNCRLAVQIYRRDGKRCLSTHADFRK